LRVGIGYQAITYCKQFLLQLTEHQLLPRTFNSNLRETTFVGQAIYLTGTRAKDGLITASRKSRQQINEEMRSLAEKEKNERNNSSC
jgi:hypothetical protein